MSKLVLSKLLFFFVFCRDRVGTVNSIVETVVETVGTVGTAVGTDGKRVGTVGTPSRNLSPHTRLQYLSVPTVPTRFTAGPTAVPTVPTIFQYFSYKGWKALFPSRCPLLRESSPSPKA